MREYPAYGRPIAAEIGRGNKPICVGVMLSTRWRYFDHVPKICIRPEEWRAGHYEFSFLRGLHVVAVPGDDCTNELLGELLVDLMAAGPALLWCYGVDGTKYYDGEDCWDITHWVLALERDRQKLPYKVIKAAEHRAKAAQSRSLTAWLAEYENINQRAGVEASLQFHFRTEAVKDQVRQLFSAPFQDSGEPAAA